MGRPRTATVFEAGPVRVTARAGGGYRARWSELGEKDREKQFTDLTEATTFATAVAERIRTGKLDQTATRVSDTIAAYLQPATHPHWEKSTQASERSLLEVHVVPRFGSLPAGAFTPTLAGKLAPVLLADEFDADGEKVRGPYPHTTVEAILGATRRWVRWAAEYGAIADELGVLRALRKPAAIRTAEELRAAANRGMYDKPSDAQVAALIAEFERRTTARGSRLGLARFDLMVRTIADVGTRWGESIALRPSDFDFTAGIVKVDQAVEEVEGHIEMSAPKSTAGFRDIAFTSQRLLDDLAEHCATIDDPNRPLFVTPRGRTPRRSNFQRSWWHPSAEAVNFPDKFDGVHSLRHYAISRWVAAGVLPADVSRAAGHVDISFTQKKYVGADRSYAVRAAAQLRGD